MTEYMAVLAEKPFGKLCEHHRFDGKTSSVVY